MALGFTKEAIVKVRKQYEEKVKQDMVYKKMRIKKKKAISIETPVGDIINIKIHPREYIPSLRILASWNVGLPHDAGVLWEY